MAPSPSSLGKQSHPLFRDGPFDVHKALDPIINAGSTYGQFLYESAVAFYQSDSFKEVAMKLKLQGYSSTQTALTEDQVYRLAARIIALNIKSPPVLHFEQQLNGLISKSDSYNQSLANKVGCTGFGIVVDKSESEAMNNNGTYYKNLNVILCHTDYDNSCQEVVSFLGREMVISGYLSGYSPVDKIFEATAISVSLGSGHESPTKVPQLQFQPQNKGNVTSSELFHSHTDEEAGGNSNSKEPDTAKAASNIVQNHNLHEGNAAATSPPPKKRGRPLGKKPVDVDIGNAEADEPTNSL
ncbi:hypothetical protein PCASD_25388 [Puccinia coronata f. sp. avenae]|uniref:Uncharacterized protein n=1 Tax=Puccinia coronata f. sp. avenae TaxID=200324 RepID=A0A2N5SHR6_9BASI|nr:hypothetical protein PCASD_25388 [Puccinia coronata f. sp. avenae]